MLSPVGVTGINEIEGGAISGFPTGDGVAASWDAGGTGDKEGIGDAGSLLPASLLASKDAGETASSDPTTAAASRLRLAASTALSGTAVISGGAE